MVDALKIEAQLKEEVGTKAFNFYARKLGKEHLIDQVRCNPSAGNEISDEILERGSTNFDKKYFSNDPEEKEFYKTDLYIWQYMDMHIKQNLFVLDKFLRNYLQNNDGNILFIDFGCGPITSGLTFAEIISKQKNCNYLKKKVYYLGIDAAHNMIKSAKYINENFHVFNPDRFKVMQSTNFTASMVSESCDIDLAILVMSFVLAPNTNKAENQPQWVQGLAREWHQLAVRLPNLKETKAIYLNPVHSQLHENWGNFKATLFQNSFNLGDFSYTGGKEEKIHVPALYRDVIASEIRGTKNE